MKLTKLASMPSGVEVRDDEYDLGVYRCTSDTFSPEWFSRFTAMVLIE